MTQHSAIRNVVLATFVLTTLAVGLPASALRVVDYNLLNYPGNSGPARAPYYRTVLAPISADVIVTEEMSSAVGPTEFLNEVLNVMEPGQWATVPFIDGNDTDASLFYKPAKVQFLGQWSYYPNPSNHLRLVHVYRLKPSDYSSVKTELRIHTAHLKASTGYESQRLAECIGIRDSLNALPAGVRGLICGDMNFYTMSNEPGYAKLLESQANNTGRVYDLLPGGSWHDGAQFAMIHTQSTCLSGGCASGAATGGMDDRFDFILPTLNLGTGQGLAVIPGTCISVGNDGLHFNKAISDAPVIPEGAAYATALQLTSDHLPLRLDLRLPARINVDPALAFGSVIVGAPPQSRDLVIGNPASPPADSLNCGFTPPANFGAPGTLVVAAGDSGTAAITMSAAGVGQQAGILAISSDAPDDTTKSVALSGMVLNHAVASLDSTAEENFGALDFGDHEIGGFTDQTVGVYNAGYNPLQARLLLNGAVIAGGGGRFSLADAFNPQLIAGSGPSFALTFDDGGAAPDSTYSATLTFTSADEPLPGATSRPDLVVTLRARVVGGPGGAQPPLAPISTRLNEPFPNPTLGSAIIRLDVARAVHASLAVFDQSGRRVATLRQGAFPPGRYALTWDGRRENGAVAGSGIYFVRFRAPGMRMQTVRLAIVR